MKYDNSHLQVGDIIVITDVVEKHDEAEFLGKYGKVTEADNQAVHVTLDDGKGWVFTRKRSHYKVERIGATTNVPSSYDAPKDKQPALTTLQMLAEIEPGKRYKNIESDTIVSLSPKTKLLINEDNRTTLPMTYTIIKEFTWERLPDEPKKVDFQTAWKAYEEGKTIRQGDVVRSKTYEDVFVDEDIRFMPDEIRGEWEILES